MPALPQWSTPERQKHLLALRQKYGYKCQREHIGNDACMDRRHYHDRCASDEHESLYSNWLLEQVDEWREKELRLSELPTGGSYDDLERARLKNIKEFDQVERIRLLKIQAFDKAWVGEMDRLRRECDNQTHYFEHITKRLNGEEGWQPSLNRRLLAQANSIASWKAEDREARSQQLKIEQSTLHTGQPGKFPGRSDMNGRWHDPVTLDEHYRTRPDYYLIQYHVSAISFQRMATIRIPSTYINLEVEIGEAFKDSPSPKRQQKRIFRGQDVPTKEEQNRIDELVKSSIEAYWASR